MRRLLQLAVLAVTATLLLGSCAERGHGGTGSRARPGVTASSRGVNPTRVPERVLAVYEHVLTTGHAPPGYVGGRVFENRERRLRSGGDYHEFDVIRKMAGRNRGPERLIVDLDTGQGWYTADHYRTFIPIDRSARDR